MLSPSPTTASEELEIMLPGKALRIGADGPVLVGARCTKCSTRTFPFPAVPVCPSCMSEDVVEEEMSRTGTLYTASTVHVGAARWHKPFTLGYVDLDNGVRVFSRITGKAAIGDKVKLEVAEIGREANGTPIKGFVFTAGGR